MIGRPAIDDPEVALAIAYAPAGARPALTALFALDAALGAHLRGVRDPMLARLRLAWWREQLEQEARGPDPVLADVARHLIPKEVAGKALAGLVDGWEALTDPAIDDAALADHARGRGGVFVLAGQLLGQQDPRLQAAGEAWALADLARTARDRTVAERALAVVATRLREIDAAAWPRALRMPGALTTLARRDGAHGWPLEQRGAPARVARMLAHRLTGR